MKPEADKATLRFSESLIEVIVFIRFVFFDGTFDKRFSTGIKRGFLRR